MAISPNSRYLYHNRYDTAFQYDLWAADIPASRKVVAVYDGFTDPFPVTFYIMQLAPDGKIYSSATNGARYLHVIHRPDEEGLGCQYQQHGIQLYKYNDFSVPNFPNYRLGPLDGSPCDTLGLDNHPKAWYRYEQDTLEPLAVEFHDLSYSEPATWSWDFGDGSAGSTERHPRHQFPKPDLYQVCLTVSNQYGSDTHCKTLYLGVSAQDNPILQARVRVWPNPFRDRLAVALSANLRSPVFRLYDMMGRLVRQERLSVGVNEIETGELPPGIYFWEVLSSELRVKNGNLSKAVK
ncbi:MAG: PKD domain-containing protein [Saprospiraceae bacterium]|nr:PKD domain-containing protein [Saprospiraceae bacterium]MDW8231012.1 PKD domain-containing protein [Saprospiraceae bacterium]